jgi:phosphoglycerate dehydrogenase-like enzyme
MTSRHKILFLTSRSLRHQQAAIDAAPADCTVTMLHTPSRAEVMQQIGDAEFLFSERAGVVDAAMIDAGAKLRLIQRLGSLSFDIDLAAARRAGIPVCTQPVMGCVRVAEHMILQMLALLKRLPDAMAVANEAADWGKPARRTDENIFAYNWSRRTGLEGLMGKTVGILGFGEIGVELARRLAGFAPAAVLYHKRSRLPAPVEDELGITYATEQETLAASDILCNLLPYTPETAHRLDAAALAALRPGAHLVSCGSGGIIDEAALAAAIHSGHLAGAALDTFEWEPLPSDNPLVVLARDPARNVLLTPHIAAGSGGGKRSEVYRNIRRILDGEEPLNRVA